MMSKDARVEKAIKAYAERDIEASKKAHSPDAITKADEKHQQEGGKYLPDLVYGALDGIVTTFAIVSGVVGANLSPGIILILGFANLLGDGVSMAFGNFLSVKSEQDYIKREKQREEWEIEHYPEGEIEEIRHIFRKKGFMGKALESAVKIVTSDKKVWVETMMRDELGLHEEDKTPFRSALATFTAFALAGFIPLVAFVLSIFFPIGNTFLVASVLTALSLFTVGSLRSLVTGVPWMKSGLQMLIVGSAAAGVAYLVGFALRGLPG